MTARKAKKAKKPFRPRSWAWLLLLGAFLAPAYDLFLPAGMFPPRERRAVIIERGKSLHTIAAELQRVGVIRSPFGFLVLARGMRLDRSVKAGQYSFRLGITIPALLRALERGMYGLDLIRLTEGLTLRQTALVLAPRLGVGPGTIDSLAHDAALLDSLGIEATSLEGWLAPDSYEWLPGTPVESALRAMVARTRERLRKATAGCDSIPFDFGPKELLTLASIVESEAIFDDERPRIARAYLNRLVKGMRLQADPTVGYAIGRGPRSRLTLRDLRVESEYNTYLHSGLPPGPICSPGYESIEAVVYATPGTRELYFVARGDGRHMFSETYAQHLSNITAARSLQAAMARARALADTEAVRPPVLLPLPAPGPAKTAPTVPARRDTTH